MKALRWMFAALAVGFLIFSGGAAQAQQSVRPCWYNSAGVCVFVSAANPHPVNASVSASITGFPTTQSTGTPIDVTTGGVTGTLPTGAVVVASNVGATNGAYCKLGASATTSDQLIPPNSWFAFTVGVATQLTCITSTSTTTVNMVGGSGLPTGSGGGGGGSGGGGAITIASGAVASGAYSSGSIASGAYASGSIGSGAYASGSIGSGAVASGAIASGAVASGAYASGSIGSGAMVDLGAIADAASSAGGTGTLSAKLRLMTTQLGTINTTLGSPFQAGGSIGNTTFAVTQGTAASLNATVVGTGTFVTQSTVTQATSSNLKAQVDPLTAASWGIGTATQNSTSATNGQLALGQFNTSPTTITSGNMSPFQMDNAGNLLVNVKVGGGTGGTSSNFGSAFPTPGTAAGFSDGTNMVAAKVGAIANVAAATNMLNVLGAAQYNATPLTVTDTRYQSFQSDVNGFLKVNVATATGLASGSTTSGQTGSLVMGATTTSAPSYTTAQTNPLSLTTAGGLRTDVASLAGTAIDTNSGNKSAGTQRVVFATDQPTMSNAQPVTPQATESHIGETGQNQIAVSVAPTVTASPYSAGNALGGLQTIANAARVSGSVGASGTGGILASMNVSSKATQTGVQIDVFIFNANPSGSTCTDKTAFVLAAADANKVVGVLTIPSTAANGGGWYAGGGTGSIAMPTYYPITYDLSSATSLFACGVVRGAITPGSTSDISYNYNILRG